VNIVEFISNRAGYHCAGQAYMSAPRRRAASLFSLPPVPRHPHPTAFPCSATRPHRARELPPPTAAQEPPTATPGPPLSFFSRQHADTPTPMPTPSPLLPENIQQTKNIKPFKAQPSLESATAVTGWYNLLISPNNTSPQTVQFIHIILHNMYDGIWAWSYNCSLFSLNAYK
jgi:hypothetical protein